MVKIDDVITHLQIIHTWAAFARDRDRNFFNEKHMEDIVQWSDDAIDLIKDSCKEGHWIEKQDYNLDTYYDCSMCGESWVTIEGTPWQNGMKYCPNCGARMKGSKK